MGRFINVLFWLFCSQYVEGYRNHLYTIANFDESRTREYKCAVYEGINMETESDLRYNHDRLSGTYSMPSATTSSDAMHDTDENPYEVFQSRLHNFLYGTNVEKEDDYSADSKLKYEENKNKHLLKHYVIGNYFHTELFNNKTGVHLPPVEFMHRGHCLLNITKDYMQTAVNAFAIFLYGTIEDIQQLNPDYVLRSARTISMMKIAREKYASTWNVVKGNRKTEEITSETLEMYRPLFKYINGREIARLNLSDERILTYIGTHADLDRHQVGVVASRYIELNPRWSQPKYLNLMNNLLCGVPMTYMRKLPENTYLQLSQQIFYHIRACDPLQRRFYLSMMTRTQALGKSYAWNARDVSRLGVLLAEVDGQDLSSIRPEAMSGIASQVMQYIPAINLKYLTEKQLQNLAPKPLNIFIRKLKLHEDELIMYGSAFGTKTNYFTYTILVIIVMK